MGFPVVRCAIGAAVGLGIWATYRTLFPGEPAAERDSETFWNEICWLGFLLYLGATIGYCSALNRRRKCPVCGSDMGRAKANATFGSDENRASRNGQRIPDSQLFHTRHPESVLQEDYTSAYYLCKKCDREFLASDLLHKPKKMYHGG
jgi:hypothetical protein